MVSDKLNEQPCILSLSTTISIDIGYCATAPGDHMTDTDTMIEKMAEFVYDFRLSSAPAEIERAARRHLADTLACGIGAHGQPPVAALVRYARNAAAQGNATLTAYGNTTSPAMAALVNGTMVRYLDANDISAFGGGHFSDGTPPLLAVAQHRSLTANDLITGTVALYEIQGALARSFDFMKRGYHALTQIAWTTPIIATRMLGGDETAAVHAAGMSGAMGMALNTWLKPTNSIPSIKGVAVGLAGQRAVECAELATLGITASPDALETALDTLGRIADTPPAPRVFDKLGSEWTADRHVIKSYPSQIYTQAAVQAALELRGRVNSINEIESVSLYGHKNVCGGVQGSSGAYRPRSREAADHSTPFVMATALLHGRVTLEEFENDAWLSPSVIEVMDNIRLIVDTDMDRAFTESGIFGVRLEARLYGGGSETVEVHQPKGHPDDPLSDTEIVDKMEWLMNGKADDSTPRRLFEHCMNMSNASDLVRLTELCTVERTG